ncbi:MAG: hypothetical protein II399_02170 [Lachnospiraceae bacterium]|nr:hypothetical protein [Lachnospiraceae bacterium]
MLFVKTRKFNTNSHLESEDFSPIYTDSAEDAISAVLEDIVSDVKRTVESYGTTSVVENDMSEIRVFKDEACSELLAEKTVRDVEAYRFV